MRTLLQSTSIFLKGHGKSIPILYSVCALYSYKCVCVCILMNVHMRVCSHFDPRVYLYTDPLL